MNIRQATKNDIDTIYELGKSVVEFDVNDETVNFWPKELLKGAVNSGDVIILVAEEQTLVGFIIASYSQGLKKATIENVFVRADFRGKGVSDKLLHEVLSALLARGCEYVATLVPPAAQDAIDLYGREGFSPGATFVWLDKSLTDTFRR